MMLLPIFFETNPSSLLSTHTFTFAGVSLSEHAPYLVAAMVAVRWLPERFPEFSLIMWISENLNCWKKTTFFLKALCFKGF